MTIELDQAEQVLLKKIVASYLSELRLTIAATRRGTSGLHAEEDMVKRIEARL